MSRLNAPATNDIATETQAVLDGIGAQWGFVPNIFHALAADDAAGAGRRRVH